MADDTKSHEASGTGPVGPSSEPVIANPTPSPTPGTKATEWTASDARGPLVEAPPVPPTHDESLPHGASVTPTPIPSSDEQSPGVADAPRPALAMDPAPPPRRSLVPVAAALVLGAVIGAGSAYLVYQSQQATTDGRGQTVTLQSVAALKGRVDALDNRPDLRPAIEALKSSVATLDGKVAALQKAAGAPASTPSSPVATAPTPPASGSAPTPPLPVASASAPVSSPVSTPASASAFDPAPLQQKIAALQATIDGLQKQAADAKVLETRVGAIQTSVDSLKTQTADVRKQTAEVQRQASDVQKQAAEVQKQASGAQAGVEAIQGQQKSFEGRISAPALAVVADSLVQQIDQGQPYSAQVDALATLGADPARIAILRENARKGVPSAKALAAQFKPLAEPILATAHKVAPDASLLDRLKSGMSGLVSIRSTSDTAGDGLDARVSRIEAALTHDDVTGAYATWTSLPADAKAKSDAWGALAKTSAEAIDAAHALQQGAIASLGGRKS